MTINSKLSHISHTQIILIFSFIFCIIIGSGVYGFGNDWYAAYFKSNLDWNYWYRDQLGWRISTLTIYGFHIGVYVTTFILACSSGILIENFFKLKKINSVSYFSIILFIVIHTWPIIMSTSNAMRQGLSMSFLFFFISAYMNDKKFLGFFFILLATFTHTSGPFYFILYITMQSLLFLSKFFVKNYSLALIYFVTSFLLSILIYVLLSMFVPIESATRIIHGDFRLPFMIINLSFILFFTYNYELLLNNPVNIFVYLFSSIALVLLFMGYNWQYERLCMMMLIPYILTIGIYIKKIYAIAYYFVVFGMLLSLTFLTGMYESFK
tara:strand:+ start:53 stop:1024 length:972 start_codon:yes stop_codon:yes gene_type:complete